MTATRNQQEWRYGYFAVIAAMLRLRLVFYFREKTILNWRDKFPFMRLRPCGSAQMGFACLIPNSLSLSFEPAIRLKEIGKYVDKKEVARLERYVTLN